MDDRTPEQRKADEDFEIAISKLCEAYEYTDGMIVDWVLITAQHLINDDGTSSTSHTKFVRPGQPGYRTMGLLDYMLTRDRAAASGNLDLVERGED